MVKAAARAAMRTSAAGNKPARLNSAHPRTLVRGGSSLVARGVTLLELLVVVTLMALASAGVVLALRDSPQHRLDLEAQQLVTWLEAARAQARTRAWAAPLAWASSKPSMSVTTDCVRN